MQLTDSGPVSRRQLNQVNLGADVFWSEGIIPSLFSPLYALHATFPTSWSRGFIALRPSERCSLLVLLCKQDFARVSDILEWVCFLEFFFFFFFRGQVATLGRNELNMLRLLVLVPTLARNEIYMLCRVVLVGTLGRN